MLIIKFNLLRVKLLLDVHFLFLFDRAELGRINFHSNTIHSNTIHLDARFWEVKLLYLWL